MPLIDMKKLPSQQPLPGWEGRFANSDSMTFAYYDVRAGAATHEHRHPNEEVWNVIEGTIEITIDGKKHVARPGCLAVIPPDVPHSVRALTDGRYIVVDHPVRESIGSASTR